MHAAQALPPLLDERCPIAFARSLAFFLLGLIAAVEFARRGVVAGGDVGELCLESSLGLLQALVALALDLCSALLERLFGLAAAFLSPVCDLGRPLFEPLAKLLHLVLMLLLACPAFGLVL